MFYNITSPVIVEILCWKYSITNIPNKKELPINDFHFFSIGQSVLWKTSMVVSSYFEIQVAFTQLHHCTNISHKSLYRHISDLPKMRFNKKTAGLYGHSLLHSTFTSFGSACRPQRCSSGFQKTLQHQANAMWHAVFLLCTAAVERHFSNWT